MTDLDHVALVVVEVQQGFDDAESWGPLLVAKSVHSAFLGSPGLAAWLREQGCDGIAVCGITTSHCCETTARAGSDIGFDVLFALDATHAFDSGGLSADQLARATAANLHGAANLH